ncbi:MAG: ferric reductase-like transmembrane domain-containing protein [Hyphomicrobiales bacterium]|nr:ferric reductase-like transmembrane domain-containing protein [Hyphomicrobiales bacterium]
MLIIWAVVAAAIILPVALAATSSLLAWRDPVYITAGFAGVIALALLLVQPMLIGGYLPGIKARLLRLSHRWVGALLVIAVVVHVGGLWITSPPDVIDALLFVSPTPFSNWGVIAMWALFATALLAMFRRRLQLRPQSWRVAHSLLAIVIVIGTIIHALLIEGTMETISKAALCVLAGVATVKVMLDLNVWTSLRALRKRTEPR